MGGAGKLAGVAIAIGCAVALAGQKAAKEMPYVTVDHPEFVSASKAGFLNDTDRLIGVTDGKIAKAYPAGILAQHGVVEDQLAEGPIAVTW